MYSTLLGLIVHPIRVVHHIFFYWRGFHLPTKLYPSNLSPWHSLAIHVATSIKHHNINELIYGAKFEPMYTLETKIILRQWVSSPHRKQRVLQRICICFMYLVPRIKYFTFVQQILKRWNSKKMHSVSGRSENLFADQSSHDIRIWEKTLLIFLSNSMLDNKRFGLKI
jgi:hypothetical protein